MRKVTFSAACSFDGYIAGPDEAVDWLIMSDDAGAILADLWAGVDAILLGRKTFEFQARSGAGFGSQAMQTYVFSRTLAEAPKGATLVRDDAVEFVGNLKDRDGGGIFVMGGGELGSALVEGGVVDEISFIIHPLLLGGGVPMFRPMARRVQLRLTESREIARDCLFVRYAVAGP